jgi:hypothetical protein
MSAEDESFPCITELTESEDPDSLRSFEKFLDNSRDGIMCLRCVTRPEPFELLFVEAESNTDAFRLASLQWPGVCGLWCRPVND